MSRLVIVAAAVIWTLAVPHPARAAAAAAPAEADRMVKCVECGMSSKVANRFTSRIVQGGSTLSFCDIGDMAAFIERTHPKEFTAEVHDFASGEWLDVNKAWFVIDKKTYLTPMAWGVAAFRDRAAAGRVPMNFEALRKALPR